MDLTFREFQEANRRRCEALFHPVDEWSPTDWGCAASGELGEACNFIKKMRRGEVVNLTDVAFELADAVTYIALICSRLHIDLETALVAKFNRVTDERVGIIASDKRIIMDKHEYHLQCPKSR